MLLACRLAQKLQVHLRFFAEVSGPVVPRLMVDHLHAPDADPVVSGETFPGPTKMDYFQVSSSGEECPCPGWKKMDYYQALEFRLAVLAFQP
jgi:hypothetical protein